MFHWRKPLCNKYLIKIQYQTSSQLKFNYHFCHYTLFKLYFLSFNFDILDHLQ